MTPGRNSNSADRTGAERTDRSGTEQAITVATYSALCEYGYADLTTRRIVEASGKSTAAIHYLYGMKNDLIVAFLASLLDRFVERLDLEETSDPETRLGRLVDHLFPRLARTVT